MQQLALAAEDLDDPRSEGRRCPAPRRSRTVSTEPSGRCTRTGIGRGAAATATMSAGSITPASRSRELRQDRRQVVVGKPVLLVEDDDRPLAQPGQLDQRRVLGADQVVIDHEQQQVGADGQARASISRASPASPASDSPGVSVRQTVASTAFSS